MRGGNGLRISHAKGNGQMKSIRLMMTFCGIGLIAGCGPDPLPAALAFCDVERPRLFTAGELDARGPYPDNLRLDLATNERGREHCGW